MKVEKKMCRRLLLHVCKTVEGRQEFCQNVPVQTCPDGEKGDKQEQNTPRDGGGTGVLRMAEGPFCHGPSYVRRG